MLYGKYHSNPTNVSKWITNWWKSGGQFKMVDYIISCITMFGIKCTENQDSLCYFEHTSMFFILSPIIIPGST